MVNGAYSIARQATIVEHLGLWVMAIGTGKIATLQKDSGAIAGAIHCAKGDYLLHIALHLNIPRPNTPLEDP